MLALGLGLAHPGSEVVVQLRNTVFGWETLATVNLGIFRLTHTHCKGSMVWKLLSHRGVEWCAC